MILERQDDGEGRGLEGTLRDSLDHLLTRREHKQKHLIKQRQTGRTQRQTDPCETVKAFTQRRRFFHANNPNEKSVLETAARARALSERNANEGAVSFFSDHSRFF